MELLKNPHKASSGGMMGMETLGRDFATKVSKERKQMVVKVESREAIVFNVGEIAIGLFAGGTC